MFGGTVSGEVQALLNKGRVEVAAFLNKAEKEV